MYKKLILILILIIIYILYRSNIETFSNKILNTNTSYDHLYIKKYDRKKVEKKYIPIIIKSDDAIEIDESKNTIDSDKISSVKIYDPEYQEYSKSLDVFKTTDVKTDEITDIKTDTNTDTNTDIKTDRKTDLKTDKIIENIPVNKIKTILSSTIQKLNKKSNIKIDGIGLAKNGNGIVAYSNMHNILYITYNQGENWMFKNLPNDSNANGWSNIYMLELKTNKYFLILIGKNKGIYISSFNNLGDIWKKISDDKGNDIAYSEDFKYIYIATNKGILLNNNDGSIISDIYGIGTEEDTKYRFSKINYYKDKNIDTIGCNFNGTMIAFQCEYKLNIGMIQMRNEYYYNMDSNGNIIYDIYELKKLDEKYSSVKLIQNKFNKTSTIILNNDTSMLEISYNYFKSKEEIEKEKIYNWVDVGFMEPTKGKLIQNYRLSQLLLGKTDLKFTEEEWEKLNISIGDNDYIKSGNTYYTIVNESEYLKDRNVYKKIFSTKNIKITKTDKLNMCNTSVGYRGMYRPVNKKCIADKIKLLVFITSKLFINVLVFTNVGFKNKISLERYKDIKTPVKICEETEKKCEIKNIKDFCIDNTASNAILLDNDNNIYINKNYTKYITGGESLFTKVPIIINNVL